MGPTIITLTQDVFASWFVLRRKKYIILNSIELEIQIKCSLAYTALSHIFGEHTQERSGVPSQKTGNKTVPTRLGGVSFARVWIWQTRRR